eukprot:6191457-Pleurochrysis_carterae.AAC.2
MCRLQDAGFPACTMDRQTLSQQKKTRMDMCYNKKSENTQGGISCRRVTMDTGCHHRHSSQPNSL